MNTLYVREGVREEDGYRDAPSCTTRPTIIVQFKISICRRSEQQHRVNGIYNNNNDNIIINNNNNRASLSELHLQQWEGLRVPLHLRRQGEYLFLDE